MSVAAPIKTCYEVFRIATKFSHTNEGKEVTVPFALNNSGLLVEASIAQEGKESPNKLKTRLSDEIILEAIKLKNQGLSYPMIIAKLEINETEQYVRSVVNVYCRELKIDLVRQVRRRRL